MLISVFTPSHDPKFLEAAWASLLAQTHTDWEWVVVLNGPASKGVSWHPPIEDDRIRVVTDHDVAGVGAAKARAAAECQGDVLLELDHDDVLTPDALEHVAAAFAEHPDAGMVYSQFAGIDATTDPAFTPFAPGNGWRYREQLVAGVTETVNRRFPIALPATPHNVSLIWYAPNHVRAFTRVAYDKAGGYDPARDVLDDQDLMSRLYQVGAFHLIDRCLYLQRSHGGNTQLQADLNARIQVETLDLYDQHVQANALAWAHREGLLALDLGGCHGKPDGYLSVDQHPGADYVHTFPHPLELPDSSVGVIRASDFLEHVADQVTMMNELHRLLAPGGMLLSHTPSSEGWGADQDPTHVARWNPNSFWYYTDPSKAGYVPEITARFQVSRITHGFPSLWHEANRIPYVTANLIAIKDGTPRNGGQLLWT